MAETRAMHGYTMKLRGAPSRTVDRGLHCIACDSRHVIHVERGDAKPPPCDLCGSDNTEFWGYGGVDLCLAAKKPQPYHEDFETMVERERGHLSSHRGRDKHFHLLPKN